MSSKTDPCGAFFNYAAPCWEFHLDSAPVDFNLDDVLELASPTLARYRAWRTLGSSLGYSCLDSSGSSKTCSLKFFVQYGNLSILEQLLDRLVPKGDENRRSIVNAASRAIHDKDLCKFRTLMNHQSTAKAMKTCEMLEDFTKNWVDLGSDNLKEWTKLITGLFDMLASDTTLSPNCLLTKACESACMPMIEKLFARAKADTGFQKQLLQPTYRYYKMGPFGAGAVVEDGDFEVLRYLCQQDGIEAHASNRDTCGRNILAYCHCFTPKVEIIEAARSGWPDTCRMLLMDGPRRRPKR